jgi:hypothetical protein
MALFELKFEIPEQACNPLELSRAVGKAGYEDAVTSTGEFGVLGVCIRNSDANYSKFEIFSKEILLHLPTGSKLLSKRQALSVFELSEEDLDLILNAKWGSIS